MIANARALRDGPLPEELVHRDDKLKVLLTALQGLDSPLGGHARIFGPSGAGKTTTARFAARRLEEQYMSIQTAHVDCLTHSTVTTALAAVCRELGLGGDLQQRAGVDAYRQRLAGVETPTLVVIDEADHLNCLKLFHILYELDSFSTVVIANSEEQLLARADDRTASRVRSGARISLDAYSDTQLVDILQRRVASALVENIVDERALWRMARLSNGNAREAIAHLRHSIKHVRAGHADRVDESVVGETSTAARADLVKAVFSRLDREHRVICEILFDVGEVGASELHEELEDRLGESVSSRTRQRLVGKILDTSGYELVARRGKGPSTRYRLTDRTRELFESGALP